MKASKALLLAAILATASTVASAEEQPDLKKEKLLGDWGGVRKEMLDRGIDLTLDYTGTAWRNFDGGVKEGSRYLGNLDAILNVDGEKLYGLKGNSVSIYLIADHGGRPNDIVGSVQGVDNMEVGTPAWKLYEAWMDQKFWNDKASVRAGLYDLNSEFYVTDSSGLFLGPTYGIGNEMAATGRNGPSIFPYTSVGVRLAVKPTEQTYVQAAVLDGVPGSLKNPRATHIIVRSQEGALLAAEAGFTPKSKKGDEEVQAGKFGVGVWRYTKDQEDPLEVDALGNPVRDASYGLYLLAEKILWDSCSCGTVVTGFARGGITDGDVSVLQYSWSAGLLATSVIPGRDEGQLGFAVSGAKISDSFQPAGSPDQEESEYSLELTYGDKLLPWLWVQPDLQYTINPGIDPALDDSFAGAVRATISF